MRTIDLVREIAEKTELTQADVKRVFETYANIVLSTVEEEEVPLPGLGKFVAVEKKPRTAINPKNPEQKIQVPGKVVLKFKPNSKTKVLKKFD